VTGRSERSRGLFLDLDGTLADSLPMMRAVYARFLERHGRTGSEAEFDRLNGPPLSEVVDRLKAAHGLEGTHEALMTDYAVLIDQAYDDAPPAEGAAALLDAGRARGWAAAVVTGHAAGRARRWLRRHGLDPLVAVVVGDGDCARGKPYPDPYLAAIERCGCLAGDSLAVEDTPDGATAAVAAGLATYVLARPPHATETIWPAVAGFLPGLSGLLPKL